MYCTKCGKKNAEDRLFCGFCGSPLNTPEAAAPEDDERRIYGRPGTGQAQPVAAPEKGGEETAPEQAVPRSRRARHAKMIAEAQAAEEEDGWPELDIEPPIPPRPQFRAEQAQDDGYGEAADIPPEETAPGEDAPDGDVPGEEDPLARPLLNRPVELRAKRPPQLSRASAPVKPRAATGARRANTVVPPRAPDPDDLFLEDEADAEDDIADFVQEYLDDYRYEDRPHGNFFVRHIRGFVTLILLAIVAVVVGSWLTFGSGQRLLGQLYISGNPATYVELGKEADEAGNYEEAGAYYLKALEVRGEELDGSDRTTAVNAANAYIRAGNSGRAAAALEYLIAIDPNDPAPYNTLKQLYPDAASRPQSVTRLLQQGAQNTGDASLAQ